MVEGLRICLPLTVLYIYICNDLGLHSVCSYYSVYFDLDCHALCSLPSYSSNMSGVTEASRVMRGQTRWPMLALGFCCPLDFSYILVTTYVDNEIEYTYNHSIWGSLSLSTGQYVEERTLNSVFCEDLSCSGCSLILIGFFCSLQYQFVNI